MARGTPQCHVAGVVSRLRQTTVGNVISSPSNIGVHSSADQPTEIIPNASIIPPASIRPRSSMASSRNSCSFGLGLFRPRSFAIRAAIRVAASLNVTLLYGRNTSCASDTRSDWYETGQPGRRSGYSVATPRPADQTFPDLPHLAQPVCEAHFKGTAAMWNRAGRRFYHDGRPLSFGTLA